MTVQKTALIVPLTLLVVVFQLVTLAAQDKSGYNWVFGNNSSADPGLEGIVMSFDNHKVTYDVEDFENVAMANNSVISDPDGNLLCYATGCRVYNSDYQIMMNGDSLNYGFIWDEFCGNGFYPMIQSTIILPDYHNQDQHVLFHKKETFDSLSNDYIPNKLLYSIIDLSEDGGLGTIVEKDVVLESRNRFVTGLIEAVKHSNMKDWWLLQFVGDTDSIYTYLMDESGPQRYRKQEIQSNLSAELCSGASQACFDQRGQQYAMYCPSYGLDVYRFDRSTGLLSNHRYLNRKHSLSTFSGLAWSPSGQYLYISASDTLLQVDTYEDNLEDGVVLIDTYDGFASPFPVNFVKMQIGPNCKIYVSSQSSVRHFSIINSPDEKGLACDFVQHGIELPYSVPPVPLPNVPNFSIDEDEVCDPTITSVFGMPVTVNQDAIQIAPNPASDQTLITFTESGSGRYSLYDHLGHEMLSDDYREVESLSLDLTPFLLVSSQMLLV